MLGWGGQGRCEQRSEKKKELKFCENSKKKLFIIFLWGGGGGGGGGVG